MKNRDTRANPMRDARMLEQEKQPKAESPNTRKLIEVKIADGISIFIPRGKSKEEAKKRFLKTHKNSIV